MITLDHLSSLIVEDDDDVMFPFRSVLLDFKRLHFLLSPDWELFLLLFDEYLTLFIEISSSVVFAIDQIQNQWVSKCPFARIPHLFVVLCWLERGDSIKIR